MNIERGRDKFKKYKKLIYLLCKFFSIFSKPVLNKMFINCRRKTGYWGLAKRYCILKNLAKSVGDNVAIYPDVYIFNLHNLSIGDNVSIHPFSYIDAYGGIEIGDDVSIAHNVTLMSANHTFSDKEIVIKDQPLEARPIKIENNCWLGAKVTVLGNTTISTGSVIGAGAVVTKNVESYSVVAGVPARKIKSRN